MIEEEFHIGNLIREKIKEKERSISWLAKKLGCDSSNLHKTLSQQHIYSGLLLKISKILEHDFFTSYSELLK